MNPSDWVISQIRTYVPMIVGAVISWLVVQGIVDEQTGQNLLVAWTSALTAAFGALYYFLVRLLAEWKPWFGVLLGVNKAPAYNEEKPAA